MSIQFDKAQQRSAVNKKALQYDVARIERLQIPGQGELILAVVADGDNENPKSPQAADVAVRAVFNYVRRATTTNLKDALTHALMEANSAVLRQKSEDELSPEAQVSLTAVALINKHLYVAHIGNNGLYLVRRGKDLKRLTNNNGGQTHDFLGLSPTIPNPSILTETLGDGDQLVLYTDGFSFQSQPSKLENEILEALSEPTVNGASRRLVSYPMGRNVDDNMSVIVIRASNGVTEIIQKNMPVVIGLAVVSIVALVILSAALFLFFSGRPTQPPTASYDDLGKVVVESPSFRVNGSDASNFAQVRAGTKIQSLSDAAYFNLPNKFGSVYLEPQTDILITQLESVKSGEEKHIVIFVNGGVVAAKLEKRDYKISLSFAGGVISLPGKTSGGIIVVSVLDNQTSMDCLEGICVTTITGREPDSLGAGRRLVKGVADDYPTPRTMFDMVSKMTKGAAPLSTDQTQQPAPTISFATNDNQGPVLTETAFSLKPTATPTRPAATPAPARSATVIFKECNDKEGSISFDGAPSISLHANQTVEFLNIPPGEHRYKTDVPTEPDYNETKTIQVRPGLNTFNIGKTCR